MRHQASRCPACCEQTAQASFATLAIEVARCRSCGHRVARHAPVPQDGRDYHEQFETGAFMDSLEATRRRQASLILRHVRHIEPGATRLVDLGCGRGWFIESALAAGFTAVGGADTSRLAVDAARRLGAHAVLLVPEGPASALSALPLRPEVLTLLDVLEHFEGESAVEKLSAAVEVFRPELRLVVVKVPVSTGILYRAASVLRTLGSPTAIEQLYQVGTTPPHHHYFTPRSVRQVLARAGLDVISIARDVDFEPASLTARARAARSMPEIFGRVVGSLSATAAELLRWEDSLVLFARPSDAPGVGAPPRAAPVSRGG